MSGSNPSAFQGWYSGLPIPFLVAGPNGQAEAKAWPAVVDGQVGRLDAARKVAFADYAPVDALAPLGGDRYMYQGANESNSSFQTRIKMAFDTWPRAGSACGVLEQLWYYGLTGAYWVQQNGKSYTFSGSLTPGQDPTSLLAVANLSTLITDLTSTVLPTTANVNGRIIPSGNPWWSFDRDNTDLTNRFAIVVPSWPFSALVTATFINSDTATVTWPFTFADTTYGVIIGPPGDSVVLSGSGKTTTGMTVNASAAWTGSVQVTAYASGVNPLNVFSSTSAGTIKKIISAWRPNSVCMGVYSIVSGQMFGWPLRTFGAGGTFGPSTISQILGSF